MSVSIDVVAAALDETMATYAVPGASIGWSLSGEREFVCRGVTSVEHPLPVTESTRFQVGSVTKTVTATALLELVRAGRVDLDVPVIEWLLVLRGTERSMLDAVTPRHLLSHQCGLFGESRRRGARVRSSNSTSSATSRPGCDSGVACARA